MNKQLSFRIHPLLAAVIVVGAFFVVLFGAYGLTRWASAGEVMGHVKVAETDLGGRTEDEALNTMTAIEIGRLARLANFVVDGKAVELQPGYTGLDIEEQAVVARAMAVGRSGNFANQFLFWLGNMFSTTEIELEGTLNEIAMNELFDEWDVQVIDRPINFGSVALQDGELVAVYPSTGVGVDREPASDVVLASLLAEERETSEIPTVTVEPELTDADVDAALAEAQQMLAGPISMVYDGDEATVTVEQLQAAFKSETVTNSPPKIVNLFDPEVIDSYLDPLREQFEAEPVNAEFVINDDLTVSVRPGSN
jgi:hypothetical protein